MVNTACAKNLLVRAGRRNVAVEDYLTGQIDYQIAARCLGLIGLACSAGEVMAGFETARSATTDGGAGILSVASDTSDDVRDRIKNLASDVRLSEVLNVAGFGKALGPSRMACWPPLLKPENVDCRLAVVH